MAKVSTNDGSNIFANDAADECNGPSVEVSVIVDLLNAHGEDEIKDFVGVSRRYRSIVNNYLLEHPDGDGTVEDSYSMHMLTIINTVMEASECFLLKNSSSPAVVADCVRFLRTNFITEVDVEVEEFDGGIEEFDKVMNGDYGEPEHWDPSDGEMTDNGMRLSPYWRAIRRLCVRGYTQHVWEILTRHSLFSSHEFTQGFEELRSILEGAPLPGGCSREDENQDLDMAKSDEVIRNVNILNGGAQDKDEIWREWEDELSVNLAKSRWNAWSEHVSQMSMGRNSRYDNENALKVLSKEVPQIKSCILQVLAGKAPSDSFSDWSEALLNEILFKNPTIPPRDIASRAKFHLDMYEEGSPKSGIAQVKQLVFDCIVDIMRFDACTTLTALHSVVPSKSNNTRLSALNQTLLALWCDLLHLSGAARGSSSNVNLHRELLMSAAGATKDQYLSSDDFMAMKIVARLLLFQTAGIPSSLEKIPSIRCVSLLLDYLSNYLPRSDYATGEILNVINNEVDRMSTLDVKLFEWKPAQRVLHLLTEIQKVLCDSRASAYESNDGEESSVGCTFWLLQGASKEFQAASMFHKLSIKDSCKAKSDCQNKVAVRFLSLASSSIRAAILFFMLDKEWRIESLIGADITSVAIDKNSFYNRKEAIELTLQACLIKSEKVITAMENYEAINASDGDPSVKLDAEVTTAFLLVEHAYGIASSVSNADYSKLAQHISVCLNNRSHPFQLPDGREIESSVPIAQINCWFDILLLSYFVLFSKPAMKMNDEGEEEEEGVFVGLQSANLRCPFDVNGVQVLMSRFAWLIDISKLECEKDMCQRLEEVLEGINIWSMNLDWKEICDKWVNHMAYLMSKGLMKAYVVQNKKLSNVGKRVINTTESVEDEVESMFQYSLDI